MSHPPPSTESKTLLAYLDWQRATFAWKTGGLAAAGLAKAPSAVHPDARRPGQARRAERGLVVLPPVRRSRAAGTMAQR